MKVSQDNTFGRQWLFINFFINTNKYKILKNLKRKSLLQKLNSVVLSCFIELKKKHVRR